jgi:hypothetical protein
MIRSAGLLATGVAIASLLSPSTAIAAPVGQGRVPVSLRIQKLEAQLEAQQEARDRQADAFDAATARVELINGALVAVLALAGILGTLLAMRWVREFAENQMADQLDTAVRDMGREIFKADSDTLVEEYEAKFAELYQRYERLVERKK